MNQRSGPAGTDFEPSLTNPVRIQLGVSDMKSRETDIRLRRFELEERRQTVSDLESMIADFQSMADDLTLQIETEEKRAGISDVEHFSYPTFAKAARERRDNLSSSIADLQAKLDGARAELEDSESELRTSELTDERDQGRLPARGEQASLR